MKAIIILALILIINCPSCAGFSCPDTLISDAQTFGCDGATGRLFNSSLLHLAPDQQALTITFDIKVDDICSNPVPMHLATVTTGASGSEIRLMDFIWNGSAVNLQSNTETTSNIFLSSSVSTLVGSWLSLAISLNISSGICGGATLIPSGIAANYGNYGYTGMALDSTIKISMCSDIDGAYPFACDVTNLKVIYTLYTSRSPLVLGQSPVVVGVYKFHEGTAWTTINEVNSSQTGYFGDSTLTTQDSINSPQWIPTGSGYGVTFTARNQFVRLPALTFGLVNNRPASLSLGVYFWMKADQYPVSSATNDPIFRYISSDGSTTRLAFYLTSNGKVVTAIGPTLSTSTITLAISTWTQVSVRFSLLDTATTAGYRMVNFGSLIAITSNYVATTLRSTDFVNSDVFRMGEFIGQISDFRIFTPASMAVNIPTCSANCALDVGNTNPPTCIKPECGAGPYVDPSYCVTCPAVCATCTDSGLCQACPTGSILVAGNCIACAPGTYAASPTSSTCKNCPSQCGTCTSSTRCQSCSTDFFLSGSACVPCPTGCKTCTGLNQCQSCVAGFALSSTVCTPCRNGTYAPSDTSPSCSGICPDHCDNCTDPSTCQTCTSGYNLQGGVCINATQPDSTTGSSQTESPVLVRATSKSKAPWVVIGLLTAGSTIGIGLLVYYIRKRRGISARHRKIAQSPSPYSEASTPDTVRPQASQKEEIEGGA